MKKLSVKTKRRLYDIAIVALAAVFVFSAGALVAYFVQGARNESMYGDLNELVEAARPTQTSAPTELTAPSGTLPPDTQLLETQPQETEPTSPWVTITDPETGEDMQILPEYAGVYPMNTDMVGWLLIEGTDISYPVMQTPEDPNYYLDHDFSKKYNTRGALYVKEDADVFRPSDNVTIFGHRTQDDTMFNQLIRYDEKSYYEQYPFIHFDTLTERHVYQIVYVFKTTTTLGEGFRYHLFVDAQEEWEFNNFIQECGWNAFYDTGVEVAYGDKLLTLSTCEYSQANGRFVIVAKRIA